MSLHRAAGDTRLRRWSAHVDRARALRSFPGVLPTSWVEHIRAEAGADRHGEFSAMPKEVFAALLTEAAATVPSDLARSWRQSVADAKDSPRDLVLIQSATLAEIAELVLVRRLGGLR